MLSKLVNNDKIVSIEYPKRTHLRLKTVSEDIIDLKLKVDTRRMQVVCQVLINDMIFHSHLEMNEENQQNWFKLVHENHEKFSILHDDRVYRCKSVWQEIGGYDE